MSNPASSPRCVFKACKSGKDGSQHILLNLFADLERQHSLGVMELGVCACADCAKTMTIDSILSDDAKRCIEDIQRTLRRAQPNWEATQLAFRSIA